MSAVPARAARRPADRPAQGASRAPMALVVAVTVVTLEALRASGPLLDRIVADGGVVVAAITAVIVYAAPALVGAVVGGVGARRGTAFAVIGLVALRLITQVTPAFLAGVALAVVAVAALVLAVRQASVAVSPVAAVTGLVLGGAADVALRTLLLTWDPVWRPGIIGWLVVLAECAALVYALVKAQPQLHSDPVSHRGALSVGRVWLLGAYLALTVVFLGSPAFLASASATATSNGLGLSYAAGVLLVGALFAVEALSRSALPGGSGRWGDLSGRQAGGIAAALLVLSLAVALLTSGIWPVLAVLVGQVTAALALARALSLSPLVEAPAEQQVPLAERRAAAKLDRPDVEPDDADLEFSPVPLFRPRSAVGFGLAGLAAGLGYALTVLLYQIHYALPLPFPNQVIPIAAALVLAGFGLGAAPDAAWAAAARVAAARRAAADEWAEAADERAAKRGGLAPLALIPAVLLAAPVAVLATTPAPAPAQASESSFRMVSWNLHYAANSEGAIDPETIAAAIEKQRPDVVLLQEVSRGWPIGGTLDGAEWLSRRLGMPYVWAPAADGQFGNVILSKLRITDGGAVELPQGLSSMRRSYATATVELPGGRTVEMIDVHLAHREADGPTRLEQLEALIDTWGGETPAVIAGDLNARPSSKEVKRLTGLGLVSAQDTTGHSGLLTAPTDRPEKRIDWIFGTPDLHFEDFVRPDVRSSDHFPLAVTVVVG